MMEKEFLAEPGLPGSLWCAPFAGAARRLGGCA
jgi:hypothetical protein